MEFYRMQFEIFLSLLHDVYFCLSESKMTPAWVKKKPFFGGVVVIKVSSPKAYLCIRKQLCFEPLAIFSYNSTQRFFFTKLIIV